MGDRCFGDGGKLVFCKARLCGEERPKSIDPCGWGRVGQYDLGHR